MAIEIKTCHDCACGLENDDWTHLDYHHDKEESDRMYALVQSSMEEYGWLTRSKEIAFGGYWHCDICWEIDFGTGWIFNAEREGC